MGVHTFSTRSNDTTVRAPEPGEVMVGNAAQAWEPRPLDDAGAFPLLSALQHQIHALAEQLDALKERLLLLETSPTARPMAHTGKK